MSLVMKLWDPRADEDVSTYDFYDIEDTFGDDGIYGFENLDHDDPPGDPNNNALKADFDFGDTEDGVDPDSYIKDGSSIDLEDIWRYVDPHIDDGKFDFTDIDEKELPKKDPEALEYNFGEEDKNPYLIVPEYFMKRVVKNALQVLMHNGEINTKAIDLVNPLLPWIEFQMYYNIETNKCFMEYRISEMIKHVLDIHSLENKINGFINANFKYDLGYIPEVITTDDQYKVCDNTNALSPYTIGYWESLTGQYRFLEDQTELMQDMRQFKVANHGDEYKEKYDDLYDEYLEESNDIDAQYKIEYDEIWEKHKEEIEAGDYSKFNEEIETLKVKINKLKGDNFSKFITDLCNLNLEYKISPDQKPEKSMQDFIDIVVAIRKSYKQTSLTEENRQAYIKEAMDLYVQYYSSNPVLYEVKMKQLNTRYYIKEDINKKIPDIYKEYSTAYYNFFKRNLPEVSTFVTQSYMAVLNIA